MRWIWQALFIAFWGYVSPCFSQNISVTKESGGSIQTKLSDTIILNEKSSLSREWITIHDSNMPANIIGTVGIKTVYGARNYYYRTDISIVTKEPIVAIEYRFVLFDIFGNFTRILSGTIIEDIEKDSAIQSEWNILNESETKRFYASIAYISKIRTKSGQVIEGNTDAVLMEAQKFSKKFTKEDLEPKNVSEKKDLI